MTNKLHTEDHLNIDPFEAHMARTAHPLGKVTVTSHIYYH